MSRKAHGWIEPRTTKAGARWVAYHSGAGKRRYVGSYTTEAEAVRQLEEFRVTRRQIDRGEIPENVDRRRTFKEASEAWIKSLRNQKSRSVDDYEMRLKLYVWGAFGDKSLTSIRREHIMDFRDQMALKFAPRTVNNSILSCLSAAFAYFEKRSWIDRHPVRGVKGVPMPEDEYTWIHTKEEIVRLLALCDDDYRQIVAFALATGLRQGEQCCLQWADVDIDKRLIRVHRGRKGTTKSGRVRTVPILDSIRPMLRERALHRDGSVFVFPGRDPRKPRTGQSLRDRLKRKLGDAQLDTEITWHDLRHTFASHWMMDGGDIFKLSKILGHSNVKQTMRYAHLAPTAFEEDYGRVAFAMPSAASVVSWRAL